VLRQGGAAGTTRVAQPAPAHSLCGIRRAGAFAPPPPPPPHSPPRALCVVATASRCPPRDHPGGAPGAGEAALGSGARPDPVGRGWMEAMGGRRDTTAQAVAAGSSLHRQPFCSDVRSEQTLNRRDCCSTLLQVHGSGSRVRTRKRADLPRQAPLKAVVRCPAENGLGQHEAVHASQI